MADDPCRAAFVALIKAENVYRDFSKFSLRQHWSGKSAGFADTHVQERWRDFKAGWVAAAAVSPAHTEQK